MRLAAAIATLLLAASTYAADAITGQWKASAQGPDGQSMEITFALKADGKTLTGTSTTPTGELPISNGTVEGDAVSFDVDAGAFKVKHKGTVSGDTLKLKVEFEGGQIPPMDMTATRVPSDKK